jgi:excisionase family DNA binding protein
MATRHKLGTSRFTRPCARRALGWSRPGSVLFAHLAGMQTTTNTRDGVDIFDTVLTLSELAARLRVSVQTIYDLRSQGSGPRGFRVGREIRFRTNEIDSWLSRMEEADSPRHHDGAG